LLPPWPPPVDDGVAEAADEENDELGIELELELGLDLEVDEIEDCEVVVGAAVVEAGLVDVAALVVVLEPPVESGTTVTWIDKAEVTSGKTDEATEIPAEISEETSS